MKNVFTPENDFFQKTFYKKLLSHKVTRENFTICFYKKKNEKINFLIFV